MSSFTKQQIIIHLNVTLNFNLKYKYIFNDFYVCADTGLFIMTWSKLSDRFLNLKEAIT